jgi:hypothetical protein
VFLPVWLSAFGPMTPWSVLLGPTPAARYVAAALLGLMIAVVGLRSRGQFVAAIAVIVAAPVGVAAVSGVAAALSSRALLRSPGMLLEFAGQVFTTSLDPRGLTLLAAGLTVLVAAVGLGVRAAVVRRTRREPMSAG